MDRTGPRHLHLHDRQHRVGHHGSSARVREHGSGDRRRPDHRLIHNFEHYYTTVFHHYVEWVRTERPDAYRELFQPFGPVAAPRVGDGALELHTVYLAEYARAVRVR